MNKRRLVPAPRPVYLCPTKKKQSIHVCDVDAHAQCINGVYMHNACFFEALAPLPASRENARNPSLMIIDHSFLDLEHCALDIYYCMKTKTKWKKTMKTKSAMRTDLLQQHLSRIVGYQL